MEKKLKQVVGKKIILVSNDEKLVYGKHTFCLNDLESIYFSYNDITPLHLAESSIEKEDLIFILNFCSGITKNNLIPELANYKNSERLTIYFKETDKYFIIISFGEFQPTLYKIYIEGIFEKKAN